MERPPEEEKQLWLPQVNYKPSSMAVVIQNSAVSFREQLNLLLRLAGNEKWNMTPEKKHTILSSTSFKGIPFRFIPHLMPC